MVTRLNDIRSNSSFTVCISVDVRVGQSVLCALPEGAPSVVSPAIQSIQTTKIDFWPVGVVCHFESECALAAAPFFCASSVVDWPSDFSEFPLRSWASIREEVLINVMVPSVQDVPATSNFAARASHHSYADSQSVNALSVMSCTRTLALWVFAAFGMHGVPKGEIMSAAESLAGAEQTWPAIGAALVLTHADILSPVAQIVPRGFAVQSHPAMWAGHSTTVKLFLVTASQQRSVPPDVSSTTSSVDTMLMLTLAVTRAHGLLVPGTSRAVSPNEHLRQSADSVALHCNALQFTTEGAGVGAGVGNGVGAGVGIDVGAPLLSDAI